MVRYTALALGLALTLPGVAGWAQEDLQNQRDQTRDTAVSVERQPMEATHKFHTPLQEFMSHQIREVADLSQQLDYFKANDRHDMVMVLYHMIRDHRLVADAAGNVLARRGDVSKPVPLFSDQPMPQSADEIIRYDIAEHERGLERTQQLLADASSPEERSVYQHAVEATQKHLNWLRDKEQGKEVALGFFGPTVTVQRIAGFREEIRTPRKSSRTMRNRRTRR